MAHGWLLGKKRKSTGSDRPDAKRIRLDSGLLEGGAGRGRAAAAAAAERAAAAAARAPSARRERLAGMAMAGGQPPAKRNTPLAVSRPLPRRTGYDQG